MDFQLDIDRTGKSKNQVNLPELKAGVGRIDPSRVSRLALFTGTEEEEREFVVKSAFLR